MRKQATKYERILGEDYLDEYYARIYRAYEVAPNAHSGWYLIFAEHEQEAIDMLIDYGEEAGYKGWFHDENEDGKLSDEECYGDSYIVGGNHSLIFYCAELVINDLGRIIQGNYLTKE